MGNKLNMYMITKDGIKSNEKSKAPEIQGQMFEERLDNTHNEKRIK